MKLPIFQRINCAKILTKRFYLCKIVHNMNINILGTSELETEFGSIFLSSLVSSLCLWRELGLTTVYMFYLNWQTFIQTSIMCNVNILSINYIATSLLSPKLYILHQTSHHTTNKTWKVFFSSIHIIYK